MPNDLQDAEQLLLKKIESYYGIIPSVDFDSSAYYFFVEFATPEELENDIVTKETLASITKSLGYNTNQWDWASWVTNTTQKPNHLPAVISAAL